MTDVTNIPAWANMWLLALAIFFVAKGLTLRPVFAAETNVSSRRFLGYIFLWPGMNARGFCSLASGTDRNGQWPMANRQAGVVPRPSPYEYLAAVTKICPRLGYHATNIAFAYLPVVYLLAALKGGRL